MRIREYQLDELKKARALQDEAAKLHIPVPVLSYQYEIADADGNIEEKGIGKSNSYTRNALNSIAWLAGLCDCAINNIYGDGGAQARRTNGTPAVTAYDAYKRNSPTTNPLVNLGTSTAEETLDSYLEPASGLIAASSGNVISMFDESTRKLVTTITRTFVNKTASTINITESGVTMQSESSTVLLYIRDVFTAIPVEPGKTITWTYVTEVAYPEP
jgi:hypothetical protein